MKKLIIFGICCWSSVFWFGCSAVNDNKTTTSCISATVVSLGFSSESAHFDYVQPMAAWEVVFKVRATYTKKGWHLVPNNEFLRIAVQDAAGQFFLYRSEPFPERIYLMVVRNNQSKLITGVYLAPPDMVPAGEPNTDSVRK